MSKDVSEQRLAAFDHLMERLADPENWQDAICKSLDIPGIARMYVTGEPPEWLLPPYRYSHDMLACEKVLAEYRVLVAALRGEAA